MTEITAKAKRLLLSGDVLLCRSNTFIGRVIRFWTKKYWSDAGYCHCAMVVVATDEMILVAEIYNNSGGRIVPIQEFLKEYNEGDVDCFCCQNVNRKGVVNMMLSIMFTKYSWITIIRNAIERFFRSKKTYDDNDPLDLREGLTCATAVAHSLKEGGGIDPCLFLRTGSVTPADLGRTPKLKLLFTI
jgi:hypothetical protein